MMLKLLHCAMLISCLTLAPQFCWAAEIKASKYNKYDGFPGPGSKSKWLQSLPSYREGNKHLAAARPTEAIKSYRKAIAIYPYDAAFYTNCAVVLIDTNNLLDAERMTRKSIQLKPSKLNTWMLLVKILALQNKTTEARKVFKEASSKFASVEDRKFMEITKAGIRQELGLEIY